MTKRETIKAAYGLYRQVWRRHMNRYHNADDFTARFIARDVLRIEFDDTITWQCEAMFMDRREQMNADLCFVSPMHLYRCTHHNWRNITHV